MNPETSTVKVRRLIGQLIEALPKLQAKASGINAMALATLTPFIPRLQTLALEQLPSDPAELDAALERAAALVLSLRSDVVDVEGVELEAGEPA